MKQSFWFDRQQCSTCLLLVVAVALLTSIYKDAQNSMAQPYDMRNRIVGSRMMEDGKSPYFYIWQEGDTVRYYDIHVAPGAVVSLATATPFYHYITEFFADFPQHKINVYWFCVEYFLLGTMCLLLFLCLPPPDRWKGYLILSIAALFTYTVGWRMHVNAGQNYLLIPALTMVCYYCLKQKKDFIHLLLFGLCAATMFLIRPICILLFVPFLFYLKRYFTWFASAGIFTALYTVFVFTNPLHQSNWIEYFRALEINVKFHQHMIPESKNPVFSTAPVRTFEGINLDTQGSDYWNTELRKGSEISNFYIIYEGIFGKRIPIIAQNVLGLLICGFIMLPLIVMKKKKLTISLEMLLFIGFLVYNMYEFFTPAIRAIYHWVQFLFPLLLLIVFCRKLLVVPMFLVLAGIYLNIVIWPSVKMEHTIGEMMVVSGILWIAYRNLVMQYLKENKLQLKPNIYIA